MNLEVLFVGCLVIVWIFGLFVVINFLIAFFIFCLFVGHLLFDVIKGVFEDLLWIIFFEHCSCFDLIFININFIIDSFQSLVHLWVSFIIIPHRNLTFAFTVMVYIYSLRQFPSLLLWLLLEKTWFWMCICRNIILFLLSFEIINAIDVILLMFISLKYLFCWSFLWF